MVLKKGSRGPQVKVLQKAISKAGFWTHPMFTNNFGGVTEKAVKRFQKFKGLKEDGVAGPVTQKALGIKIEGAPTAAPISKALAKKIIDRMKLADGFKNVPEGLHIVGERTANQVPNHFRCKFYLFRGEDMLISTTGTTIPGTPSLLGGFLKYNKVGSAVVVSNRVYYNVWKYGLHGGWMRALRQRGNKIMVGRDGNKNNIAEDDKGIIEGYFGINFHTAAKNYLVKAIKKIIGNWSHGCQVINNTGDYVEIIDLCEKQDSITYTLLDEEV